MRSIFQSGRGRPKATTIVECSCGMLATHAAGGSHYWHVISHIDKVGRHMNHSTKCASSFPSLLRWWWALPPFMERGWGTLSFGPFLSLLVWHLSHYFSLFLGGYCWWHQIWRSFRLCIVLIIEGWLSIVFFLFFFLLPSPSSLLVCFSLLGNGCQLLEKMVHDRWSMIACGVVVGRPVWLKKRKKKMSGDGFFIFSFFFLFLSFLYTFFTLFFLFYFFLNPLFSFKKICPSFFSLQKSFLHNFHSPIYTT